MANQPLSRELKRQFGALGRGVRHGHCFLVVDELNKQIHDRAFSGLPELRDDAAAEWDGFEHFNSYKSANLILDSYMAEHDSELQNGSGVHARIVVQDRHWLSQFSYNRLFTPERDLLSDRWIADCSPRFALQVYLTCTRTTRVERAATVIAQPRTPLHGFLARNIAIIERLDEICLTQVTEDAEWMIINTDHMSPSAIASRIVSEFNSRTSFEAQSGTEI